MAFFLFSSFFFGVGGGWGEVVVLGNSASSSICIFSVSSVSLSGTSESGSSMETASN